jgi:predicted phage-related endonuclease
LECLADAKQVKSSDRERKIKEHLKERESLKRTIAPLKRHMKPLGIEKKKFKRRK